MRKILILAGPSAVGKTTLANALIKREPRFDFIRSATTRAKRGDGFDDEYIYLTTEDFKSALFRGEILEHTEFSGNFYGTPASEIERIFEKDKIPLLILDINGVRSLKSVKRDFGVFSVYLTEDVEVIDARLFERVKTAKNYDEALSVYEKRREQNRRDLENYKDIANLFDFTVKNEEIIATRDSILTEFFK